jgi:beta-glucosidase
LIGPLAGSAQDMLGCWPGQGRPEDAVTLESALADRLAKEHMVLEVARGMDSSGTETGLIGPAVEAARRSDIVVLALGESARLSGEAGSRSRLDLPGRQEELLEAVAAAGKPTILVVFSGRPLALARATQCASAVLMAWFPGLQGGPALVRALFGDADISGRLTVSVPRSVGQVPVYYDHLNTGRPRVDPIGLGGGKADPQYTTGYRDEENTPLYPFGYGLGYTTFTISGVRASAPTLSARSVNEGGAGLTVEADVRNTGSREGTQTAQLYIRLRGTSVARPVRELKGFQRVHLMPGETRRVTFRLGREELAFWNIDMNRTLEPGSLYIWVSSDSATGEPVRVGISG